MQDEETWYNIVGVISPLNTRFCSVCVAVDQEEDPSFFVLSRLIMSRRLLRKGKYPKFLSNSTRKHHVVTIGR